MVTINGSGTINLSGSAIVAVAQQETISFSWDYDNCIVKKFRVEGKCSTPTPTTNPDNTSQLCPPNYPDNTTSPTSLSCLRAFVATVDGCTVNDVCKKLKEKYDLLSSVTSIKIISSTTTDPNCLKDVTPTLADCQECCDFLITENIIFTFRGDSYYLGVSTYQGSGTIIVTGGNTNQTGSFSFFQGSGTINVIGYSPNAGSPPSDNVGTILHTGIVVTEIEELIPVFAPEEAANVSPIIPSVVITECCNYPISQRLLLQHNLNNITALNSFLLRNTLSVYGNNDSSAVSLTYKNRTRDWRGVTHLRGLGGYNTNNSTETWTINFLLNCELSIGGNNQYQWNFSVRLRQVFGNSPIDFTLRMIYPFSQETFCQGNNENFINFAFSYDVENLFASPTSFGSVIVNDEFNWLKFSSLLQVNPLLQYNIYASTDAQGRGLVYPHDLSLTYNDTIS